MMIHKNARPVPDDSTAAGPVIGYFRSGVAISALTVGDAVDDTHVRPADAVHRPAAGNRI